MWVMRRGGEVFVFESVAWIDLLGSGGGFLWMCPWGGRLTAL